MQKITPCLWFDNQAEDAANYYVSIFTDSRIHNVSRYGEGAPVPAGTGPPSARLRVVETDGALDSMHFSLEVARLLEAGIWGQGFPQPVFCDTFAVENQRVVGERHLKLMLVKNGRRIAIIGGTPVSQVTRCATIASSSSAWRR